MPRILDVWFYTSKAGRLVQDDSGRLRFAYDPAYLKSKEPWPLSVSMPLREAEFDERVARPLFSGLLPEELIRDKIAKLLGVSAKNPFSLLEIIGGECAGAISLYPEGRSRTRKTPTTFRFSTNSIWTKSSSISSTAPSSPAKKASAFPWPERRTSLLSA